MEKNQIFAILISLFLLLFIFNYIRKGKLKEKFSLMWILSAITFLIFAIWFEPMRILSEYLGIHDPLNLLFMLGGVYLIFILLHFSFALSKTNDNYKTMAQRVALLEDRLTKYTDAEKKASNKE